MVEYQSYFYPIFTNMSKVVIILFCFIAPFRVFSQVMPKEGSLLNYRIIGFSFPQVPVANKYKIEIAKGNHNRIDSFTKNIVVTGSTKKNRIIAEVPSFGSQYTWRIVSTKKKKNNNTPLYHFSTLMNDHVDTNKLHLRVLQPAAEKYKDYYVSVDAGGVLYDMTGKPVWFIPDTNGIGGYVADLKFTTQGTITFLYKQAYEIDYNANILWKAPNKGEISQDTSGEFYHHEFTRLFNGHYMVLGMQVLMCRPVSANDSNYIIAAAQTKAQQGYRKGRFGTIIEYDEQGNVVWSWKALNYLQHSDVGYYNGSDSGVKYDPHDNAFYFDENNKWVYLGFRNLNRILKIEYPSGKILRTYGEVFQPRGLEEVGSLFCNQHSINRTQDGYLYVYNNNSCGHVDSLPTVVIIEEPELQGGAIKKIWQYTTTIDSVNLQGYRKQFGSGGNAIELPDRSFFVDMGSDYSKLFIVNREKKELWSALPERFLETDQKWAAIHEYRANIISRKDLETLIWNAETSTTAGKK